MAGENHSPFVVPPHVDQVLDEIGRRLQLTPTQYQRAASAYGSVGEWLEAKDSPLGRYQPDVYPQGSMALRTTVRPLQKEEFDLDIVCEVHGWQQGAMDLYSALGDRLRERADYAKKLEPKKRCWRLNYAGDFHLDALPGREDRERPGGAIEVPDRELSDWKPSNPRDFVAWFDARARPYYARLEERKAPLPPIDPADAGDPLRRAVQLMKRHRDVRFAGGPDNAPRSIVLTTLAAKHYQGEESVGKALIRILGGIMAEMDATVDVLKVPNPVNGDENFADAWENDRQAYDEFVSYIRGFAEDLKALIQLEPDDEFLEVARRLFGMEVAERALEAYKAGHGAAAAAALERIGRGRDASAKPWGRA